MKRWYTQKSFKLMKVIRFFIVLLLSPLWFPLFAISYIGIWTENLLAFSDTKLDQFLDKVIPQIK